LVNRGFLEVLVLYEVVDSAVYDVPRFIVAELEVHTVPVCGVETGVVVTGYIFHAPAVALSAIGCRSPQAQVAVLRMVVDGESAELLRFYVDERWQNATATHFERELAGARPTNLMAYKP
jgi:hypothetical protein